MSSIHQGTDGRPAACLRLIPGTGQDVAIGAGPANSAPFANGTTIVWVYTTVDARIRIGPGAVVAAGDTIHPGGVPIAYGCAGGDRISMMQVSGPGTGNVTETY